MRSVHRSFLASLASWHEVEGRTDRWVSVGAFVVGLLVVLAFVLLR